METFEQSKKVASDGDKIDSSFDDNFRPLPIADLLDGQHRFIIPSFQRGYRWEKKQVLDLLEDIKQFANDDTTNSDSYFLQPIVVKATQYKEKRYWELKYCLID